MIFLLNSFENSLSDDNAELLARQKTLIEELKLGTQTFFSMMILRPGTKLPSVYDQFGRKRQ